MARHKPVVALAEPPIPPASRFLVVLGCALLTGAAIASSLHPTAGNWGLHGAAFLAPSFRNALLAAMVIATALVAYGLFRPHANDATATPPSRRRRRLLALAPWLLLLAWLVAGSWYPVKEALLGDSAILLQDVDAHSLKLGNEPLSIRILDAAADALRVEGIPIDHATLGRVSRFAAIAAGSLLVLIALEIGGATAAIPALALLLTLGIAQLYLGYVEAYPIALVFVFLYLWLGLRAAREKAPLLIVGIALGLAAAAHVATLLLFPSYVVLALRAPSRVRAVIALAAPLAVAGALFIVLGFPFEHLTHPFRIAAQAAAPSAVYDVFRRPYGFASLRHAADVGNAVALAAPVALVLLLAAAFALPRKPTAWPGPLQFLAAAGIPGILVTVALMTPVAPAQDWDLFAFLLAPAAILAIAAAATSMRRALQGPAAWGLATLSLALLASFVLVNADSRASIARFDMVVSDPARVSPFGRAYANEILWILHRDRGEPDRALGYAQAAFEAEPTNPRNEVNFGHALLVLRRVNEAIPHFQAATAGSTRWDAPYNLGLSFSSLRRYPEALAALAEAQRRDPERPEVWAAMVHALVHSGQEDSAGAVYTQLKERWPDYVEEQEKRHAARQISGR